VPSVVSRSYRRYLGFLALALTSPAAVAADASTSAAPVPAVVFERSGDLYAIAVDGSRTVRLTQTRVNELTPAVSPDERWIAFSHRGKIGTIRVDGSHRIWLTRAIAAGSPAWAPDGRTIFFERAGMGRHYSDAFCASIYRIAAAGGPARRVTDGLARPRSRRSHENPAVAPDGRRIVFSDWLGCEGGLSSPRLRVVDPSGRPTPDLRRLRRNNNELAVERYNADWSADGRRLAFMRNGNLMIANRDGSGERRIARWGYRDYEDRPSWSRDGRWIAFTRSGTGGSLFIVRPDGTGLRRLARTRTGSYSVGGWLSTLPR
jgi:Tol biopolymer transport system component